MYNFFIYFIYKYKINSDPISVQYIYIYMYILVHLCVVLGWSTLGERLMLPLCYYDVLMRMWLYMDFTSGGICGRDIRCAMIPCILHSNAYT